MSRITLDSTIIECVLKISEGNAGAVSVLGQIIKQVDSIDPDSMLSFMGPLLQLDEFNIYGPRIWVLYKDHCKQHIDRFIALLRSIQLGIKPVEYLLKLSEDRTERSQQDEEELLAVFKSVKKRLPNFCFTSL